MEESGETLKIWSTFIKSFGAFWTLGKENGMSRKRYTPEQIISLLREAELALL